MPGPLKDGVYERLVDEALAALAEVLVRCILSVEGRLGDCRVLRSDAPDMDRAVLESIQRRRYKPALRDGIPVEVRFNFKIKLRRPP